MLSIYILVFKYFYFVKRIDLLVNWFIFKLEEGKEMIIL